MSSCSHQTEDRVNVNNNYYRIEIAPSQSTMPTNAKEMEENTPLEVLGSRETSEQHGHPLAFLCLGAFLPGRLEYFKVTTSVSSKATV